MPIYDYRCESCNHVFEIRHSMDAEGVVSCPQCGGQVQKLISAPASVLDWRLSESVHDSNRFRSRVPNKALRSGG